MNKKALLIILDGWGMTQNPQVSALEQANTPYLDYLNQTYPTASLETSGLAVGLPEGQMGNSEVGHMNLGAGRIVYQDFVKINKAVESGSLATEKVVIEAFTYAKENNKKVHFLGLLSDGGVHSHINHLKALIKIAETYKTENYIHAFTDGRDVDPHSGIDFIKEILEFVKGSNTQIASVIGRYYAMDRDNRWKRVKLAYDLLVNGIGNKTTDIIKSIEDSYNKKLTDEFIKPLVVCNENNDTLATIEKDDVVIFYNFRTDRGRELTQVLTQKDFPDFEMKKRNLYYVTMTNYDESFKGMYVIFDKDNIKRTLGEIVSKAGRKQIRIAETEKYPHVTFFFSGGREQVFKGEKRILVNSPKVATYDLQPEMSANEVKDKLLPELKNNTADLIILNFANGDMVGHTGVFKAAVKAAETVDACLKEVVETALKNGFTSLIIADHGNAECMIKPDGSPHTAHTTNPVPLILVDKDRKHIKSGILANMAPTILEIMGIDKPEIMNEESLLQVKLKNKAL
jgi:2,3-bisphosphoglycerate-independent phosphoglycerate mutase